MLRRGLWWRVLEHQSVTDVHQTPTDQVVPKGVAGVIENPSDARMNQIFLQFRVGTELDPHQLEHFLVGCRKSGLGTDGLVRCVDIGETPQLVLDLKQTRTGKSSLVARIVGFQNTNRIKEFVQEDVLSLTEGRLDSFPAHRHIRALVVDSNSLLNSVSRIEHRLGVIEDARHDQARPTVSTFAVDKQSFSVTQKLDQVHDVQTEPFPVEWNAIVFNGQVNDRNGRLVWLHVFLGLQCQLYNIVKAHALQHDQVTRRGVRTKVPVRMEGGHKIILRGRRRFTFYGIVYH